MLQPPKSVIHAKWTSWRSSNRLVSGFAVAQKVPLPSKNWKYLKMIYGKNVCDQPMSSTEVLKDLPSNRHRIRSEQSRINVVYTRISVSCTATMLAIQKGWRKQVSDEYKGSIFVYHLQNRIFCKSIEMTEFSFVRSGLSQSQNACSVPIAQSILLIVPENMIGLGKFDISTKAVE